MTCFWDSLRNALNTEDYDYAGITASEEPKDSRQLAALMLSLNRPCNHVSVNGTFPTKQQKNEFFKWIKDYNVQKIGDGHWTSTSDPFLILVCQVFKVAVKHFYKGSVKGYSFDTVTIYSHVKYRRVLEFGADAGHFFNR